MDSICKFLRSTPQNVVSSPSISFAAKAVSVDKPELRNLQRPSSGTVQQIDLLTLTFSQAAASMLTCFGGSLAVMNPTNVVTTIALGTLACFGLGGVIVPAATVAMIAAPDALITTCAALSLSVRAVGGAIGYSIYYNVGHAVSLLFSTRRQDRC